MNAVTKGSFAVGNKVTPLRDLIEFSSKIAECSWDETFPLAEEEYLIEEAFEYIPAGLDFHQRQRWLYWCKPSMAKIKIKLYGFTMKQDRMGFDFLFNSNLFIPTTLNYDTR